MLALPALLGQQGLPGLLRPLLDLQAQQDQPGRLASMARLVLRGRRELLALMGLRGRPALRGQRVLADPQDRRAPRA